jgi:hypothetical protein
MASGRRPVPNSQARQGSTLAGYPSLRQLQEGLRELIEHCTDARPDRRPPNAQVVLEEFERFIGPSPAPGTSESCLSGSS